MRTHELKIDGPQYDALALGKMRAQLRRDDRKYEVGDMLILKEWEPIINRYTGRTLAAKVTHVWKGDLLPDGYVLLSVRALK